MQNQRLHSEYTKEALKVLGGLIQEYRKKKKMTAKELASRAGISARLLKRIEEGSPVSDIGTVFEVAYLCGLPLFGVTSRFDMGLIKKELDQRLMLMPDRIRRRASEVKDDF